MNAILIKAKDLKPGMVHVGGLGYRHTIADVRLISLEKGEYIISYVNRVTPDFLLRSQVLRIESQS